MCSCIFKLLAFTTVNTPIRHVCFLVFTFSKNVLICIGGGVCVLTHVFPSVLQVDCTITNPCLDTSQQLRYGFSPLTVTTRTRQQCHTVLGGKHETSWRIVQWNGIPKCFDISCHRHVISAFRSSRFDVILTVLMDSRFAVTILSAPCVFTDVSVRTLRIFTNMLRAYSV
jgi:hypothetical protein